LWRLRARKQFGKIIVDALHAEVRLAVEGRPDIMDAMRVSVEKPDDGEDEIYTSDGDMSNLDFVRQYDRITLTVRNDGQGPTGHRE